VAGGVVGEAGAIDAGQDRPAVDVVGLAVIQDQPRSCRS
jgi:hypothetical protein